MVFVAASVARVRAKRCGWSLWFAASAVVRALLEKRARVAMRDERESWKRDCKIKNRRIRDVCVGLQDETLIWASGPLAKRVVLCFWACWWSVISTVGYGFCVCCLILLTTGKKMIMISKYIFFFLTKKIYIYFFKKKLQSFRRVEIFMSLSSYCLGQFEYVFQNNLNSWEIVGTTIE